MERELYAPDTISGKEGRAYAKINGKNELLFYARTIEATAEKIKAEVKAIGKRWVGHKTTGISGSGSMSLYYMSPLFRSWIADYGRTGRDVYFDLVIENDDPSSAAGKETVLLKQCNLDSTVVGKLDGDSDDPLEEDCDFTFEGYEVLQAFKPL